ncbi:hypothetical protein EHEL_081020 [Encephalitozoon hellem ATCC 50504]|uniref:Uncharacterized protein n=1 Tax=Encephalitozoon hellem TaxID=27973 RepID=A0A9Q9F8L4_ENCHE|nr:uncharacterized protein EHEL_081020 [Encephalitozoon hellem ATCC 50504]AFM98802.1 hypothetical protein EHEL_081020 [Encephalitozoon hellem ATCC 50504]UTX43779.1 hypothetical protein GPU96_08g15530 [Encephalitozoon hellem]|eukprot:XP_003887783.1 hypothetical protein EHEL_081020 [Encephalitozoon hellem ATCC 50504]
MESQAEPEKNISYTKLAFFFFMLRTVMIGLALIGGPYFSLRRQTRTFKVFVIFLDITNILQFIFLCDIIYRKILFQYLLYIPVLAYTLTITTTLLINAERTDKVYFEEQGRNKKLALSYIYVYIGIIIGEFLLLPIIYRRLKSDFMWANFKKVGADPDINNAFKRREQFNAIRRFMVIFLCGEVASFNVSIRDHKDLYFFITGTQIFVLLLSSIFLNEEYAFQRKFLLVVSGVCTLASVAYITTYISLSSSDKGHIRKVYPRGNVLCNYNVHLFHRSTERLSNVRQGTEKLLLWGS